MVDEEIADSNNSKKKLILEELTKNHVWMRVLLGEQDFDQKLQQLSEVCHALLGLANVKDNEDVLVASVAFLRPLHDSFNGPTSFVWEMAEQAVMQA